jgi:hypothetical protein
MANDEALTGTKNVFGYFPYFCKELNKYEW